MYPKFTSVVRDGVREFDLDVEVAASGFKKEDRKVLEEVRCEPRFLRIATTGLIACWHAVHG